MLNIQSYFLTKLNTNIQKDLNEAGVNKNLKQSSVKEFSNPFQKPLQYKYNLSEDSISFSSRKSDRKHQKHKKARELKHKNNSNDHLIASVDLTYINILKTPLKSTKNKNFVNELNKVSDVISLKTSARRISSLSTYLKEKMIGFEVPEYEFNKSSDGIKREKKGGYQWFERGLENLLIGSKKANLKPEYYQETAEELFGLLSLHDNYWKSQEFADYLASLKTSETINNNQSEAVDATLLAIKELNKPKEKNNLSFTGQQLIEMKERSFTPMKFMEEICNSCAYTGKQLKRESKKVENRPSADHIIPHSWESSKNDDGNFLITSMTSNTERGHLPLLKFLKGYSETEPLD